MNAASPVPLNTLSYNVPDALYHSAPGISKSQLADFADSPRLYWHKRTHPKEPTPAMIDGTLTHCAVLEADRFVSEYVRGIECDRRTKQGKADWAAFQLENEGREVIAPGKYDQLLAMRNAVWDHPTARKYLLRDGDPEVSVRWYDADYDLDCRCRPDFLAADGVIVDLKTTGKADPQTFNRSVWSWRYHWQDVYYRRGVKAVTGDDYGFAFVVVERDPPHCVAVYQLNHEFQRMANAELADCIYRLKAAQRDDCYPSYNDDKVTTLRPTSWQIRQYEQGSDQ